MEVAILEEEQEKLVSGRAPLAHWSLCVRSVPTQFASALDRGQAVFRDSVREGEWQGRVWVGII